jgi:hypothetical protein
MVLLYPEGTHFLLAYVMESPKEASIDEMNGHSLDTAYLCPAGWGVAGITAAWVY